MSWQCPRCGTENPSSHLVCAECDEDSPALRMRQRSIFVIGCLVALLPLFCLVYALWSLWR